MTGSFLCIIYSSQPSQWSSEPYSTRMCITNSGAASVESSLFWRPSRSWKCTTHTYTLQKARKRADSLWPNYWHPYSEGHSWGSCSSSSLCTAWKPQFLKMAILWISGPPVLSFTAPFYTWWASDSTCTLEFTTYSLLSATSPSHLCFISYS